MTPLEQIKRLVDGAEATADNELASRQEILEHLIREIRKTLSGEPEERYATVILFKPSGKYDGEEPWRIPRGATGPYDMWDSPDFRRIDGGAVLVPEQEPWGYPHIL